MEQPNYDLRTVAQQSQKGNQINSAANGVNEFQLMSSKSGYDILRLISPKIE